MVILELTLRYYNCVVLKGHQKKIHATSCRRKREKCGAILFFGHIGFWKVVIGKACSVPPQSEVINYQCTNGNNQVSTKVVEVTCVNTPNLK